MKKYYYWITPEMTIDVGKVITEDVVNGRGPVTLLLEDLHTHHTMHSEDLYENFEDCKAALISYLEESKAYLSEQLENARNLTDGRELFESKEATLNDYDKWFHKGY